MMRFDDVDDVDDLDETARTLNEFYKKGCQEKFCLDRRIEVLSRDPAHSVSLA